MNSDARIVKVGNVNPSRRGMNGDVFFEGGLAPTVTTNKGEGAKILVKTKEKNAQTGIPIKNATKQGYLLAYDGDGIDISYLTSKTKRGRVQPQMSQTLTTSDNIGVILFEE